MLKNNNKISINYINLIYELDKLFIYQFNKNIF